jgi:hypothetical protein
MKPAFSSAFSATTVLPFCESFLAQRMLYPKFLFSGVYLPVKSGEVRLGFEAVPVRVY